MAIVNNAAGAAAVTIQDGGNSITVDGTLAISSIVPGTGATDLGKAEDSPHSSGDVGVQALAVRNSTGANLTSADLDYSPISVTASGEVNVNLNGGGTNAASVLKAEDNARVGNGAGIIAMAVRNDALSTLVSADGDYSISAVDLAGRHFITGQVAHDAVVAGNPVVVGAVARTSLPTAVADGDASQLLASKEGRIVTCPYHVPTAYFRSHLENGTTTETQLKAAPGVAGQFLNVVTAVFVNDDATTAITIALRAGAGGSIIENVSISPKTTVVVPYLIPLRAGDNTSITAQSSAAVAWKVTVTGYTGQD